MRRYAHAHTHVFYYDGALIPKHLGVADWTLPSAKELQRKQQRTSAEPLVVSVFADLVLPHFLVLHGMQFVKHPPDERIALLLTSECLDVIE